MLVHFLGILFQTIVGLYVWYKGKCVLALFLFLFLSCVFTFVLILHNMIITCFHLPYFHVSNNVVDFTKYSCTLMFHRRCIDFSCLCLLVSAWRKMSVKTAITRYFQLIIATILHVGSWFTYFCKCLQAVSIRIEHCIFLRVARFASEVLCVNPKNYLLVTGPKIFFATIYISYHRYYRYRSHNLSVFVWMRVV